MEILNTVIVLTVFFTYTTNTTIQKFGVSKIFVFERNFSKQGCIKTVKTLMFQKIYIPNKCCSFELFIRNNSEIKMYHNFYKDIVLLYFFTLTIISVS